jgi:hypothetical protein
MDRVSEQGDRKMSDREQRRRETVTRAEGWERATDCGNGERIRTSDEEQPDLR